MKTKLFSLCLFSLLSLAGMKASAQFSIDSFTIAGGGTSAGGLFALSGTIGQAATGATSGGSFSLAGGFWGAIPTPPPAPTVIEISLAPGRVHLRFNGIPGRTYDIERAHSVTGPWPPTIQPFATITMPIGGIVQFADDTALFSTQSFYRTRLRQEP